MEGLYIGVLIKDESMWEEKVGLLNKHFLLFWLLIIYGRHLLSDTFFVNII